MVTDMGYMAQLYYQLPLLVVVGGGCVLLLLEAFARAGSRRWVMHLGVATCAVALATTWLVWRRVSLHGAVATFSGMIVADKFSLFLTMVFLFATLLAMLISADFFSEHATLYGELYPLMLFSTAGMIVLAMAGDLVTVFLGVEIMSLGAYVMTGAYRRAKRSSEAAMKYFLTGAFATAVLIYGIALVYGMTGTTNLGAIRAATAAHIEPLFIIGMLMLIVAMGFKVAAVPFHMWAPDAYEGAPTPVTGYMAAGVKAAGIAGILRVFVNGFGGELLPYGQLGWATIFAVLAVITMTVGNVAALRQDNIKRMLAYSSISHAGYLLIGVVAAGVAGDAGEAVAVPSLLYYLLAYTFTTLGAFGVVAWVGRRGDERQIVDDWAGLGSRHPAAALAMTIFLLSLGGMPPTGGFFGKFYVFRAAMEPDGQLLWLVVAAVINSVVSIYYYLRVVMAMYFREPTRESSAQGSPAMSFALVACAVLVLVLGLLPESWLDLATASNLVAQPTAQ
jgi:NADH-quinone oxidoreductase subunit N